MDRTTRVIQAARRRLQTAAILRAAGRALAIGLGAALPLVVVAKLIPERVTLPGWPWIVAGSVIIAGAVAFLRVGLQRVRRADRHRPSPQLSAAVALDQSHNLKDRLSSVLAFGSTRDGGVATNDPFVSLAVADAEALSLTIDTKRVHPKLFDRSWQLWPVLAAATAGVGMFMPEIDLLAGRARSVTREQRERIAEIDKQLAQAVASPPPTEPPTASPDDPAQPRVPEKHAEALAEIRRELTEGRLSPEDAAQKASGSLATAAQELERSAEQLASEHDQTLTKLSESGQTGTPQSEAAQSELVRALREADFARAAEAARALMNPDRTSPVERAKAAEELRSLAEDLRKLEEQETRQQSASPPSPDNSTSENVPSQVPDASSPQDQKPEAAPSPAPKPEQNNFRRMLERAAEALKQSSSPPKDERPKPEEPTTPPASRTPERPSASPEDSPSSDARPENSAKESPPKPQEQSKPTPDASSPLKGERSPTSQSQPSTPRTETTEPTSTSQKDQPNTESRVSEPTKGSPTERKEPPRADADAAREQNSERGSPTQPNPDAPQRADQRESSNKPTSGAQPQEKQPQSQPNAQRDPGTLTTPQGAQGQSEQNQNQTKDQPTPSPTGSAPGSKPPPDKSPQSDRSDLKPGDSSSLKENNPEPSPDQRRTPNQGTKPEQSASPGKDRQPDGAAKQPQPSGASNVEDPTRGIPVSKDAATPSEQPQSPSTPSAPQGEKQEVGQTSSQGRPGVPRGTDPQRPAPSPQPPKDMPSDQRNGTSDTPSDPTNAPNATPPKPTPAERGSPQAGQEPSTSPTGLPQNLPEPTPEAVDQLAKELKRLADAPKESERRQQDADELRRRAEELVRNTSPQQRKQLERWAQELAQRHPDLTNSGRSPKNGGNGQRTDDNLGTGSTPGLDQSRRPTSVTSNDPSQSPARTELLDARSKPTPGERVDQPRVVAEWFGEGRRDAPSTSEVTAAVQSAVRSGERAIEEQAVPSRFDGLLRRYFSRLKERAQPVSPGTQSPASTAPSTPPAEPARDAP
ncbi:MAG: hypothetical protein K2W85_17460 [Phycisphaerales bacterium]|nr:hypothetical protein [Phycisphaerales bacterium]